MEHENEFQLINRLALFAGISGPESQEERNFDVLWQRRVLRGALKGIDALKESSRSPGCSKAEVDDALICQALNMRREIYFGAVMGRDEFDAVYLDGLSDTVRAIAKREGHEL